MSGHLQPAATINPLQVIDHINVAIASRAYRLAGDHARALIQWLRAGNCDKTQKVRGHTLVFWDKWAHSVEALCDCMERDANTYRT